MKSCGMLESSNFVLVWHTNSNFVFKEFKQYELGNPCLEMLMLFFFSDWIISLEGVNR